MVKNDYIENGSHSVNFSIDIDGLISNPYTCGTNIILNSLIEIKKRYKNS